MHPSAQAAWQRFITKYEGDVAYMYLDTKGLVTVGIGNLIDPVGAALSLPFQWKAQNSAKVPAGRRATRTEIETEWRALKNSPKRLQLMRGGASSCAGITNLELSAVSRQLLFNQVTYQQEAQLKTYFPALASWPGDAQLGLMAMAWGLGKYFPPKFPKFTAACNKKDFDTAAAESQISSWRPERNQASRMLFRNAARVLANPSTYQASQTYYPEILLDTIQIKA